MKHTYTLVCGEQLKIASVFINLSVILNRGRAWWEYTNGANVTMLAEAGAS